MTNGKIIYNKVVLVFSPNACTGKTTIANNLAYLFANRGYLTSVIELDRYTGTSTYIHDINVEKYPDKDLKNAIQAYDINKIKTCFLQSSHCNNLFTLSLTKLNRLDDLYKFPQEQIKKIIDIARDIFDIIILDAPSNYIENGLLTALNIHPNNIIQILDNNIITLEKMKKYDEFFINTNISINNIITVVNKDEGLVDNKALDKLQKSLNIINSVKCYSIPYYPLIIKCVNEGKLITDIFPGNKKEKHIMKTFNSVFKDIVGQEIDGCVKKYG